MALLGEDADTDLTELIYQAVHAAGAGAYYPPYVEGDTLVIPLYGGAILRVPLPARPMSPPPQNTLPVAPVVVETGNPLQGGKTKRRKSA
jgi:hypothetical protein